MHGSYPMLLSQRKGHRNRNGGKGDAGCHGFSSFLRRSWLYGLDHAKLLRSGWRGCEKEAVLATTLVPNLSLS